MVSKRVAQIDKIQLLIDSGTCVTQNALLMLYICHEHLFELNCICVQLILFASFLEYWLDK